MFLTASELVRMFLWIKLKVEFSFSLFICLFLFSFGSRVTPRYLIQLAFGTTVLSSGFYQGDGYFMTESLVFFITTFKKRYWYLTFALQAIKSDCNVRLHQQQQLYQSDHPDSKFSSKWYVLFFLILVGYTVVTWTYTPKLGTREHLLYFLVNEERSLI